MFRSRLRVRAALAVAVAGLVWGACSGVASAQLKEAQDRGWSGLKDGYSLVASMKDNKSNRTGGNFETALSKVMSSMADMKPYIEKMGDRVADDDKSYAGGLRDNILSAWKGVAEAREKVKTAYDAAKGSPEKVAEISAELDTLKAALEKYDDTCKIAYLNYKARWEEIQKDLEKVDGELKAAQEKIDAISKKDDELYKDGVSLIAEEAKVKEEKQKLQAAADQIEIVWLTTERNRKQAQRDRKADDDKKYAAELLKIYELQEKLIDARVASIRKDKDLEDKMQRNEEDRARNWKDMKGAQEQMNKFDLMKLFQRFTLWDTEFPAKNYSYQSMK